MTNLEDYDNPFDAITEFEDALSTYTNAPYVITTDCCTHAIELCFRYKQHTNEHLKTVTVPNRTYLSVPMMFHKLDIPYIIINHQWHGEYNFGFTNIWDSARCLMPNMYKNGQMQCLSFGRTKPLEIGRGGAILLDDLDTYNWLKRASYDGRDLSYSPWQTQETFTVGYHYMMRPEECIEGLDKLNNNEVTNTHTYVYPDISKIKLSNL